MVVWMDGCIETVRGCFSRLPSGQTLFLNCGVGDLHDAPISVKGGVKIRRQILTEAGPGL